MKKVTILVDAQNIYYTTKQAYNCSFDYNEFWAMATAGREVFKAIAYSCHRGDQKQHEFQNILRAIGFEVKLKPYIQRIDGSAKCDWDVGITIDAMECAAQTDVLVLVTGDGDFDLLADKIKNNYHTEVEIYGVPQLTAASLVRAATKFIPIEKQLLLNKRKR
ncbi:MAG: NYN domain-containing protein [Gammaproteobacteria bacterium]|nr:NYN domain-containing protein [Gammaproteobacteria bacterium]MDH5729634.1 NYN domain-containing protein [Gammaproteobacteria bacterium]